MKPDRRPDPLLHLRRATRWALALSPLLLVCTDKDNPFADLSNAAVHVIDRSFGTAAEGDSLRIFTTYSMRVVVALREEVDSFAVIAPSNRAGDTTVFRNIPGAPFEPIPYPIPISLTDTGLIDIRILTFRSSGETVVEALRVRAISPLRQQTVNGMYGDILRLATDSVGDHDVYYHWSFGGYAAVKSAFPVTQSPVPLSAQQQGTGSLWVADLRGERLSPAATFAFAFNDTSPPLISLASTRIVQAGPDTIVTGDSVMLFRARIEDPGLGLIGQALINGASFDEQDGAIYSKRVTGLIGASSVPLALSVWADDQFGNHSSRTFWVLYNDTVSDLNALTIRLISPSTNQSVYQSRDLTVIAIVQNETGDSVHATVAISVNDSSYTPFTLRGGADGALLSCDVTLPQVSNTIHLSLSDPLKGFSLDTLLTLQYAVSAVDTVPPVIADVSWNGKDLRPSLIVDQSPIDIRVIAFDQGVGVDTLRINGVATQSVVGQHFRWITTLTPAHSPQGTPVVVYAVDRNGNASVDRGVALYNRRPRVGARIGGVPIRARREWRDTLVIYDDDGDNAVVGLQSAPTGLSISGNILSWTPADSQAGTDRTISVTLYDGFETVVYSFGLQVLQAENAPCSLGVSADAGVLDNGILTVSDTSGPVTLRFTVYDRDPPFLDNHTVTVIHQGMRTVTAADTARSVTVVVDPKKAAATADTVVVAASDRAGASDILRVIIMTRSPLPPAIFRTWLLLNTLPIALTAPVTRYPLLVSLNDTNFVFGAAAGRGQNMRFTTPDGTVLPHEIDRWDSAGANAQVWVLADTIRPATDTQWIMLTVDTLQDLPPADPAAVFDTVNGFGSVWHLGETFADATQHHYDGVNQGTTAAAGAIDGARQFNGTTNRISVTSGLSILSSVSRATISAWAFQQDTSPPGVFQSIMSIAIASSTATQASRAQLSLMDPGILGAYARVTDNLIVGTAAESVSLLGLRQWHFVSAVFEYDADTIRLYIDGTQVLAQNVDFSASNTTPSTPSHSVYIGVGDLGTDEPFYGLLDEVRVSRVGRSAGWMALDYESQRPDGTFITFTRTQP